MSVISTGAPILLALLLTGCRIPVVRLFWEQVEGVQFSPPRLLTKCLF